MESLKAIIILILLFIVNTNSYAQIIQKSGYIYSEVASIISIMPSDSGNPDRVVY